MIKQLIDLVSLVLAVLAVPVILVCIYDQLVLGPKRPLTAEGVPAPGPRYVRIAYSLLPFVLLGVAFQIGIKPLVGWFMKLVVPLSFLAIPVVLLCAYDHWVAAPRRPKTAEGYPARAPLYVRIAYSLLPFVLIAVVMYIGVPVVFGWIKEVAVPLSWLAAPVGVLCAVDSWLFAPRRAVAAGTANIADPPLLRVAYMILPVLVVAVIVRMISAETLDFSLVLLVLSVATGAVWAIDHFLFRKPRETAAAAANPAPVALPEPGTVDYARSFFPVAFIVLLVRAFIFEPFRIPSDSMMPTLLDGDFIVVNKYAYGLRWPVINEKFANLGSPQRGDVVVFRYPPKPERELHQASRGPAGRPSRDTRRPDHHQWRADPARREGPLQRRLLSRHAPIYRDSSGNTRTRSCRAARQLPHSAPVRTGTARTHCQPATGRKWRRTSAHGFAAKLRRAAPATAVTGFSTWFRPATTS